MCHSILVMLDLLCSVNPGTRRRKRRRKKATYANPSIALLLVYGWPKKLWLYLGLKATARPGQNMLGSGRTRTSFRHARGHSIVAAGISVAGCCPPIQFSVAHSVPLVTLGHTQQQPLFLGEILASQHGTLAQYQY